MSTIRLMVHLMGCVVEEEIRTLEVCWKFYLFILVVTSEILGKENYSFMIKEKILKRFPFRCK